MQEINVTLTFLLIHPGYLCVSPTTKGTFFIERLGGPGTLAAGVFQTLSVQDGEHNCGPSTNAQGPIPFWIFN